MTWRFDRSLLDLAAAGWGGRIEAVFGHAAVLNPDGVGAPVLTVLAPGRGLVPCGLELAGDAQLRALHPGTPAKLAGRRLVVGDHPVAVLEGDGTSLALGDLPRPHGEDEVPRGAHAIDPAALGRQLASLPLPPRSRVLLASTGPADDAAGTLGPLANADPTIAVARPQLALLAAALVGEGRAHHPTAAEQAEVTAAAQHLCGLGPGSTPTGDDLLAGATAACWRLAQLGTLAAARCDALCLALSALPDGATTPVAHEMLRHAARGAFPEPLVEIARAIGTETDLGSRGDRLRALGSTTGADMFAGLVAVTLAATR